MTFAQTRRRFLTMTALAGTVGILPARRAGAAEPALETTTVRFGRDKVICFAPEYVCEALLRAEGFTDIRYIDSTVRTQSEDIGRGKFDFKPSERVLWITAIDAGVPITLVTGVHATPGTIRRAATRRYACITAWNRRATIAASRT